jgi:hypothetical protein
MRRSVWIVTVVLVLVSARAGRGKGDSRCCPPPEPRWWQRLRPVGGWCPYGGPLLKWWNRCWFPRGGVPDDYCRKPLPCCGWPPYPPYYKAIPYCSTPPADGADCPPQGHGP